MAKSIIAAFFCVLAFSMASGIKANELPITNNLAAQEAREIEEGIYAAPPGTKMQMHLYSLFSNQLAWPRTSLKVCFWNGTPERQVEVAGIADELTAPLPIKFSWKGSDGKFAKCPDYADDHGLWQTFDVRVALSANSGLLNPGDDQNAFFAMIGQQKPMGRRATINLPFVDDSSKAFVRHNVLHEFCHVLGCLHEFQREVCEKDFNEAAISQMFSLSPQQYRDNFEAIPSGHAFGVTASNVFDKKSVMMYTLTKAMFNPDVHSECENENPASVPSAIDMDGLKAAYLTAGLRMKLQDFSRLAASNRQIARSQAFLSASLNSTNAKWQSHNLGLGVDGSTQGALLEQLARDADLKAKRALEDARSYELSPDILRKVKLALSHFPQN